MKSIDRRCIAKSNILANFTKVCLRRKFVSSTLQTLDTSTDISLEAKDKFRRLHQIRGELDTIEEKLHNADQVERYINEPIEDMLVRERQKVMFLFNNLR